MASDITLETLYTVGPQLRKWDVRPVNIVHDDIISEIPKNKDLLHSVIDLVTTTMKEIPKNKGLTQVPFESEWKLGYRWGSLHEASDLPIDFFENTLYN